MDIVKKSILIFFILNSSQIFACKCAEEKNVKKSFKNADLVISGLVQDVQYIVRPKNSVKQTSEQDNLDTIRVEHFQQFTKLIDTLVIVSKIVEVQVKTSFKGQPNSTVILTTGGGLGDCGYAFEKGKEYLVYAFSQSPSLTIEDPNMNFFYTDRCTRTNLLDETSDITVLDKLRKNKN